MAACFCRAQSRRRALFPRGPCKEPMAEGFPGAPLKKDPRGPFKRTPGVLKDPRGPF